MRRAVMRRQLLAAATLYNTPPVPTPGPAPTGGGAPTPTPPAPTPTPPGPVPVPGDPANPGEQVLQVPQRWLNQAMAKEKKQGATATLRDLATAAGLDPETTTDEVLKALLTDAKATRDAALTEEQRRAADLEAREAAVAAKEAAATTAATTAQKLLRDAKQQAILAQLGVPAADLDVAQAFLTRELADDADDATVLAAAEALKTARPVLFTGAKAAPGTPPAPGGAPAGGPPARTPQSGKPGDHGRARAAAMGLT
ncbi:hypothetical protein ACIF6L_34775 [Kitasatospora sp. NPDC086009]|uniref:hypothetical protein n=1 Tax=unclassified Kitasatospora TaxID=2633591 RepID=UPI0037C9B5AE